MKLYKFFIFIILLAFIQSNIIAQKKGKKPKVNLLAGKWETVHNPIEASDLTLEFSSNKRFKYLLTSHWEGTYKLEGTKLLTSVYIPLFKKYKSDTSTVLLYSDTLVQIGKDHGVEVTNKMVRQSGSDNNSTGILGNWVMSSKDEEHSIVTFTSSGKYEINNILKSFNGNYIIRKDTVTVFLNGTPVIKNRFVFERGYLLLYSQGKTAPITLERVKE
jgi:hypothetical protein